MKLIIKLFLFTSIVMVISACQSNKKKENKAKEYVPSTMIRHGEPKDNLIFYKPPKPTELYAQFNKEEILFVEDLTANPTLFQNYETQEKQAVGLGIYIADLAYVSIFERTHLINDYYVPVFALSEALRIPGLVDVDSFKESKGNTENMAVMSDSIVEQVANYLFETEQEDVLILSSVGIFVEALYLAIKQVNKDDQYKSMIFAVKDQKENFSTLYSFGIANSNSPEVEEVLMQIKPLHEFFADVDKLATLDEINLPDFNRARVDEKSKIVYDIRNKLLSSN